MSGGFIQTTFFFGSLKCLNKSRRKFLFKMAMHVYYRVLKGEGLRGGGNWGTLTIPREDWGALGNIGEY